MIKLIFLQVGVFAGLVVVLWIIFHGQLNEALKKLNISLKNSLQKEEELRSKEAALEEEREKKIEEGKKEAKEIIETAKKEALQYKNSLQSEAEREKEIIIQRGQHEIEKMKRSIKMEIEEKAIDLSIEIIKELLNKPSHKVLHDEIIKEAIREMEVMDKGRFFAKPDKVTLITAYSLEDVQKQKIKDILSDKLDKEIALEEEIKESLIAGFILNIDSMIIDASLKNRLKKIIPLLLRR